jgi:hypothetical protein
MGQLILLRDWMLVSRGFLLGSDRGPLMVGSLCFVCFGVIVGVPHIYGAFVCSLLFWSLFILYGNQNFIYIIFALKKKKPYMAYFLYKLWNKYLGVRAK